jgi:hypothetical protein
MIRPPGSLDPLLPERRQATIEFEYKVPEGSSALAEIAKCVDYCRKCLV